MGRTTSWTVLGGAALLIFGLVIAWGLFFSILDAQTAAEEPDAAVITNIVRDDLDELPVSAAVQYVNWLNGDLEATEEEAMPQPIGVMIENLLPVRPQSGLSQAKIVYETLAEGGATRFLVLFDGTEHMEKVGPVRSVRHYYLEWASEYDAAVMHAGGSPKGLEYLSGFAMRDLECIGRSARYCFRDTGIAAPHNLFSTSELLTFALRDNAEAWGEHQAFAGWVYKDQKDLDVRPEEARAPTVHFSSYTYDSQYEYNRTDNCYNRINGGQPHTDALTGSQICVKNVIVQFVPAEGYLPEKGRLDMNVTGTGRALIFRDGDAIDTATWAKESREGRTRWLNEDGEEIDLVRGSTWVHVVPGDRSVEY